MAKKMSTTDTPSQLDQADKMPAPAEPGKMPGNSKLKDFFLDLLKDIYWAEQALLDAIPEMEKASSSPELSKAFSDHLAETQIHVQRLELVFNLCGQRAAGKKCKAMEGLIAEGQSIMGETDAGSATRDAALIAAAQKVEHYEIAAYGCLAEYAKTLGMNKARGILEATLEDEKKANNSLTLIAQSGINWEAEQEPVEENSVI